MREVNFSIPSSNRAAIGITTALYDRRALDCTSDLPLINSLNNLSYLTASSARIREIVVSDGGIEKLVRILKNGRGADDFMSHWKWNLAFQCVVNIGVRGSDAPRAAESRSSEHIRTRVVEANIVPVIATILDNYMQHFEKQKAKHSSADRQDGSHRKKAPKDSTTEDQSRQASRNFSSGSRSDRRLPPPPPIETNHPHNNSSDSIDVDSTLDFRSARENRIRGVHSPSPSPPPPILSARGPRPSAGRSMSSWLQEPANRLQRRNVSEDELIVPPPMTGGHREEQNPSQPESPSTPTAPPQFPPPGRPRSASEGQFPLDLRGSPAFMRLNEPLDRPGEEPRPRSPAQPEQREPSVATQPFARFEDLLPNTRNLDAWERLQRNGQQEIPNLAGTREQWQLGDPEAQLPIPAVTGTPDGEAFNITFVPVTGEAMDLDNPPVDAPLPASPAPPPVVVLEPPTDEQPPTILQQRLVQDASPADAIVSQKPRDIEVVMALQLLAYLTKYCNLRPFFSQSHLVPKLRDPRPATDSPDEDPNDSEYCQPDDFNLFPLVEKFTVRQQSRDLRCWAGVVMRNLCRKDKSKGDIRQCAYYKCGKWEAYTRQFAKCRRCRQTKYCSKECQKNAWVFHRHWCEQAKDANAAAGNAEEAKGGATSGGQSQEEGETER